LNSIFEVTFVDQAMRERDHERVADVRGAQAGEDAARLHRHG
jgi:hypothetical protein